MKQPMKYKSSGFTLIELITVIIILGVLATAISSFIKFGTQVYTETTARDQLVSSARFAIERLNREVRNALPNSLRLKDVGAAKCLEFTPVLESTIYTDIPVAPEDASSTISVIRFDESSDISNWSAIVYPLTASDVYNNNGKVHGVDHIIDDTVDEWTIVIDNADEIHFAEDSPTQRLYFINGTVEYCVQGERLTRDGVLMAQDIHNLDPLDLPIELPFEVLAATLQRNAMVQIHLLFEKNEEKVTFNNEIQVLNVP